MEKQYLFNVTGGFDINAAFTPELDATGTVRAFTTPKGEEVRLIVALEIESGGKCRYVTSEQAMAEEGFANLEYDHTDFETADEDEA